MGNQKTMKAVEITLYLMMSIIFVANLIQSFVLVAKGEMVEPLRLFFAYVLGVIWFISSMIHYTRLQNALVRHIKTLKGVHKFLDEFFDAMKTKKRKRDSHGRFSKR